MSARPPASSDLIGGYLTSGHSAVVACPRREPPAPPQTLLAPAQGHPGDRPRVLAEADCRDILQRLARLARGGGYTGISIWSTWTGYVRWGRNQISTSGEMGNNFVKITRNVNGAPNEALLINETSDAALIAAARRAERMAGLKYEHPASDLMAQYEMEPVLAPNPTLFIESTYQLDADRRAAAAIALTRTAAAAGMLSAGYIEVAAHSMAYLDTTGHVRYCAYTTAQCSMTVRDSTGNGSGWAGVDWPDWTKIDGAKLSEIALDKCLRSRNPVAIEPGRYTTILEPQAVCDFVGQMVFGVIPNDNPFSLPGNTLGSDPAPFGTNPKTVKARRGERVVDPRITISADPMDPDLAFPPFNVDKSSLTYTGPDGPVFHPVTWIEDGILKNLSYDRWYAINKLGQNTGLPNEGAFRMSGGDTTIEEMIASTQRGLLVTRFDSFEGHDFASCLGSGYTRDGLWLIEQGKISKPVKNMRFTESILFALNNIEQLGVPQRVFHPNKYDVWDLPVPVIVPPMKIKDFSFTALTNAI